MDTKNQSKKKRFSVYNVNFESKLYISLFSLLIIGLFVTTRVSIRQFNIYIEHSSQDNLSQLVDVKKTTIEEKVKAFKNEFSVFANQTIQYNAIRIKDAFNNFDLYDYNDLIDPYNVTLTEYYKDEIIGKIKWHTPAFEDIYPKDSRSIVLQTLFIANNPNPDQKEKLLHVQDDNSTYNSVHGNLHPLVRDLSRKWKVSNVYLIDGSSGNVLYNMSKNITLGTNLYNGPYQASALSTVFQKALADKGNVVISDYEAFVPNLNNASGYAAISLNDDNAVVMVAEIGPDFFQNFIFDEWMFNKDEATSLSIVGPDHLIRTNDKRGESFGTSF